MDDLTSFKDLGIPCIVNIFSRLGSSECATAACVSQLWAQVAAEDALWKPHLFDDFATTSCSNYDGRHAASYKSAYASWRTHFRDVYGPMLSRSLAAWSKTKTWLRVHSPRILESLNPGATTAEVAAAEAALGHPLPTAMRVLYRVHNGQSLVIDQQSCEEGPPPDLLMGLFGTTAFYDHVTSTQLVPLDKAVRLTRLLRSMRPLGAGQTMLTASEIVYAHSFRISDKLCVVDANTGAVALKLANRDWPVAPSADSYPGAHDGILRWFEEYASRLSAGMYCTCAGESSLTEAGLKEDQAISLFPQTYPHAATAITRGVKVTWSSVLVPQESRQGRLMFAYSVRYSLLTDQQQEDTLTQLAAQEQAWQQQQQQQQQQRQRQGRVALPVPAAAAPAGPVSEPQQGGYAGSAAAAAAGSSRSTDPGTNGVKAFRQSVIVGSCAASAGEAAVPPTLAKPVPWRDAAAEAAAAVAAAGGSSRRGSNAGGSSSHGGSPHAAVLGAGAISNVVLKSDPSSTASPSSCQLESRHWVILNAQGSEIDRVDGEGVVGLYPLLYPGMTPFAYASCTPCPVPEVAREAAAAVEVVLPQGPPQSSDTGRTGQTPAQQQQQQQQQQLEPVDASRWQSGPGRLAGCVAGCMEGSFTFVGGSLMQRSGESFEVMCPRLVFAVPEYFF